MKKVTYLTITLSVFILFTSVMNLQAFADERKDEQQMSEEQKEQQRMLKLWQEYTSPGEKHKHLEYFVGEWESTQKIFSQQPGVEPRVRRQEIRVKSLFGGRFTEAHIKILQKIMGIDPAGTVITGHDNYRKKFWSVTFGNIGTDYSLMSGTLDETGKIRTDYGEMENFFSGEKYRVKAVTTIIDENKYTYEYYRVDSSGNEIKTMEITYFRKK